LIAKREPVSKTGSAKQEFAMNTLQRLLSQSVLVLSCFAASLPLQAADLLDNFDIATSSNDLAGTPSALALAAASVNGLAAQIQQNGNNNQAILSQQGLNSLATIAQQGNDQQAYILQQGSDLAAAIKQVGEANNALISQNGSTNAAIINQYGNANNAAIEQNGTGQQASITQYGNNQNTVIRQY
jgi:minor curlin subunit